MYNVHVVELEVLFFEPEKSTIATVLLFADGLKSHLEK